MEPVFGSLSDDISDIYLDIGPGLKKWSCAGTSERRDIVWTWKNNFEIHWGEHATSALRVLYYLLFRKIEDKYGFPIGLKK